MSPAHSHVSAVAPHGWIEGPGLWVLVPGEMHASCVG